MSSLTFGPKWVRDLSSGDTGAAAPPNTPPPRKYKLAEFRYGREEMLALVTDEYEMPLGLKEFEDIINEKPNQPLAFIPLSDEEERCQMGGVNSVLVLKMTGRGSPGLRGRGGIRGRGRGRGEYPLHRSTSEEPFSNRNSWSESTRGGFNRPVGRGESIESGVGAVIGGVGRGFEIRQRIPSEGSFPGKPGGEYWRTNSREPQTPVSEEEAWSLTAGNKPWTGKKGSADNNKNWRTGPKELHKDPDALHRSKSWTRSNHERNDGGLPEWCLDDYDGAEDSMPGTFDASGQFRAFKDDGFDLENDPELNDSAFADDEVTKEDINDDSSSDNSRQPKLLDRESPKNETEGKSERTSFKNDNVNTDKDKFKSTGQNSVEKSETKNENFNNTTKTVNPPELLKTAASHSFKANDEDFEFSLDHITSMVANLGDESDEEEWVQHKAMNQQQAKPTVPRNSSQQNMDPSILFVKKAEPGKNINGLQDWIYRDPQGEIQGPFTNEEMFEWLNAGYFTMSLLVRRVCDEIFLPLGDVFKLWGTVPFTSKTQPQPVTNQLLLQHLQVQQQQHQQQQQQQQQQEQAQKQQQQQQQAQQQQQQQQMRQALLQQLQVNDRPQELGLPKEVSVWGESTSATTTPNSIIQSPWGQEKNSINLRKSPQNAISLQQIEEEQKQRAKLQIDRRLSETQESLMRQKEEMNFLANDAAVLQEENKGPNEEGSATPTTSSESPNKKSKRKKKKNKSSSTTGENNLNEEETKMKHEADLKANMKQREKEELQRKALEALKQQQQIQQQQKLVEQQRLVEEQNRREEEIHKKQLLQQQHMQQMMYQKQLQQQQHQQRQRQQQQQQQQPAPWTTVKASNSAPSLAEIQRNQERKEAELQEHMKVIHQQEILQQQHKQQQRWNQQSNLNMHHQRNSAKSLMEIQAEEARKAHQQDQIKQQQYRQQQKSQNYNPMPWNASGQPIGKGMKPTLMENNSGGANFWDDVMGISSNKVNGSNSQRGGGQSKKGGMNDFPPMSSNTESKSTKREAREQEMLNRIFQQPSVDNGFIEWVDRNLPAVKKVFDVPTVAGFLQDVESAHEINDYMSNLLGESPEKNLFVREFLNRRNKSKKAPGNSSGGGESRASYGAQSSAPARSAHHPQQQQQQQQHNEDGFEEMRKNKKKKKMQKLDPNLLGFQCNAAPESLNRDGDLESSNDAMARSKK